LKPIQIKPPTVTPSDIKKPTTALRMTERTTIRHSRRCAKSRCVSNGWEALKFYTEQRAAAMAAFALDDRAIADNLSDPDVIEAFASTKKEGEVAPDPVEILMRISKNNSWHQSDEKVLAELSVDEYEKLFRRLMGEELRRATGVVSDMDRTSGASERMKEFVERGKKALYRIASDNALNKRRVRRLGFSPPPKQLVLKTRMSFKGSQQTKENGK
jgi:hypothetical protein